MECYVTENYDFYDAIYSRIREDFEIISTKEILNNSAIVSTTKGRFYCETFEDKNANIYMKVYPVI